MRYGSVRQRSIQGSHRSCQQGSKCWGKRKVDSIKIMQSISAGEDLQQKLSQNSLDTTFQITLLKSGLLYLPRYYQAKLKLSFPPRAFLALCLLFCVPGLYIACEAWLKARPSGTCISPEATWADGLWTNHWLVVRKLADLGKKESVWGGWWWSPHTNLTDNAVMLWFSPWTSWCSSLGACTQVRP